MAKLTLKSGKTFEPSEKDIEKWSKHFPTLDIPSFLKRMGAHLDCVPEQRPVKNMRRFVFNWLQKHAPVEKVYTTDLKWAQNQQPKSLGWSPKEPGIAPDEVLIRTRVLLLRSTDRLLAHPAARRAAIQQLRFEGKIAPLGAARKERLF